MTRTTRLLLTLLLCAAPCASLLAQAHSPDRRDRHRRMAPAREDPDRERQTRRCQSGTSSPSSSGRC